MTEQITGTGPPPPPPPELPEPTPGRRHPVLAWVLGSLGVLVAVIVIAGFLIHLPYVIISPGSATPLDSSVVQIDGAQTYPHGGNVLFLTVRVSTRDPNVWRVVTSWLDPDRDIEKRSDVVGCLSDAQNQAFNTELMDQSQNDAKYVALTRLGYAVHVDPAQIRVVEVCPGKLRRRVHDKDGRTVLTSGTVVSDQPNPGSTMPMPARMSSGFLPMRSAAAPHTPSVSSCAIAGAISTISCVCVLVACLFYLGWLIGGSM